MSRMHPCRVLVLAAAMSVLGCSAADDATQEPSGPVTGSSTGSVVVPTVADGTGRAGGGASAAADGGRSADLGAVAAARDDAVIRVVYEVTDPTGSSLLTWSQDPPQLRIEDANGLTVSDGTSAVTCPGPDRSPCTGVPVATAELAGTSGRGIIEFGLGLLDARDELPAGLVVDSGERVLAGREARCSSLDPTLLGGFTGDTEMGPAEFCTDSGTGWPLLAVGAGLSVVAIEVGAPAGDDFVLP